MASRDMLSTLGRGTMQFDGWVQLDRVHSRLICLLMLAAILAKLCFRRLRYLWDAPQMIQAAYDAAGGKPFIIQTPSNAHVMLSDPAHLEEFFAADTSVLSLHALAREWLQPKHTMQGFTWHEQRGMDRIGFVRVLQTILPNHLPQIVSSLRDRVTASLPERSIDKEQSVALFPLLKQVVAQANCAMFFGEKLGSDPRFVATALQFAEEVVIIAEALRLLPSCVRSSAAFLMRPFLRSGPMLRQYIKPEIVERMATQKNKLNDANLETARRQSTRQADCMQWLIDASPLDPPWSDERMLGEVIALWFGSVHQLSMTAFFAITDLADHPEYYEPLRRESVRLQQQGAAQFLKGAPRTSSFLKESARFSFGDAVSSRRKALRDFCLSDGTVVRAGDWVCVPQGPLSMDPQIFARPRCFDGSRFLPERAMAGASADARDQLTLLHERALVWGGGKTACPGRFYAAALLKIIMMCVVLDYECPKVVSRHARSFSWRSTIVPRSDYLVSFKAVGGGVA